MPKALAHKYHVLPNQHSPLYITHHTHPTLALSILMHMFISARRVPILFGVHIGMTHTQLVCKIFYACIFHAWGSILRLQIRSLYSLDHLWVWIQYDGASLHSNTQSEPDRTQQILKLFVCPHGNYHKEQWPIIPPKTKQATMLIYHCKCCKKAPI